jgi:hypothetical protein
VQAPVTTLSLDPWYMVLLSSFAFMEARGEGVVLHEWEFWCPAQEPAGQHVTRLIEVSPATLPPL